jgi:FAD/FMN-containing dehydrogenase
MRGIPFLARTGGHSLTSSSRSIQEAIIIDMRGLNSITYDAVKQQMTVGGGVVTGEFANATFSHGMEVSKSRIGAYLRHFQADFEKSRWLMPMYGSFWHISGCWYRKTARYGFRSESKYSLLNIAGKYGYLNDNMVSIRMLLANGTIITASETINKDIFWAVRGAGHNFGIALDAAFQIYPQQNQGMHYIVDFEFQLDKVEMLFELINEIVSPMPKELAIFVIGRKRGATGGVSATCSLPTSRIIFD